jgi:hypothetical protein
VGCLIPPGAYDPGAEGEALSGIYVEDGKWCVQFGIIAESLAAMLTRSDIPATPEVFAILTALQEVHDTYEPHEWPAQLARLEKDL